MRYFKYAIKGVIKIQPTIYKDKRGYFFESFNSKKYKKIIGNVSFVQDDHSFSKKNVLRGIHFQIKKPQSQLYYLVSGKIFLVIVDFRPLSKTFLKYVSFILDSKNHTQIYTAPGIGSGFYALDKNIHLIYKISKHYERNNEIGVLWNDKKLKIKWPCKSPLVSEKDKNNLKIKEIYFNKYKDLNFVV